ncbi:MAG: trehalose-phosphatase [Candidatus Eiseniibacteriota bacterium]|nr:MAG: trehalose-phosphatase [Candidatus Eisenbacteria bacterium]
MGKLGIKAQKGLVEAYFRGQRRLLFLDYDGTLTPFAEKPRGARPDDELLSLLEALCRSQKNEVVIVSGRDRNTLDAWLGELGLGLVAEHGAWVRDKEGEWEVMEHLRTDWKEQIRPILDLYVERTPGSHVEEKEFSLVWHYREADPEEASVKALELKNVLSQVLTSPEVGVLEGSKIVEVKNMGINKGHAAWRWLGGDVWDFVLAMGDDLTDEDLFSALPKSGYSIKVGPSDSRARFRLASVEEARALLKELVSF